MRAREFLIEYSREKTTQVFGSKLIDALRQDSTSNLPSQLKTAKTLLRSPDMNGIKLDQVEVTRFANYILHSFESTDPTKNKEYVRWLAKVYSNENIKLEDIWSNGADWLETYNKMKLKRILAPEFNDINKLSFKQLYNIVQNDDLLQKLESLDQGPISKGKYEIILDNAQVRIIHPQDEDSAKYYGQGTTWCTAAKNNNMFNQYNKSGPMFILLPKKPNYDGEKYQIHAGTGQYMDEGDNQVNELELLSTRFGNLLPLLKTIDNNFNNSVVFADDEVLVPMLDAIKEIALEYVGNIVTEWQVNDDYYNTWLHEQGYVDENGDIDWEQAPSYFDYNSEAESEYNHLVDAVTITPWEAREGATEYLVDEETSPSLNELDRLVAFIVRSRATRATNHQFEDFAHWIVQHTSISKDNKVTYRQPQN